jgi:hypothetical protein
MTVHTLKIADAWYRALAMGEKRSELRRNDRDFQVGDTINFTNRAGELRDKYTSWRITHVLEDFEGLADGYAILSVRRVYR